MYVVEINGNACLINDIDLVEGYIIYVVRELTGDNSITKLHQIPTTVDWQIYNVKECNLGNEIFCTVEGIFMSVSEANQLFKEETGINLSNETFKNILCDYFNESLYEDDYDPMVLHKLLSFYDKKMKLVVDCSYREDEKISTVAAANINEALDKVADWNDYREFWQVDCR